METAANEDRKEDVVVNPEFWAVMSMGVVILIAIATSNRSLRREMNERFNGLSERVDRLSERVDQLSERMDQLSERIDRLSEQLGDVRERLGRVEGLLEGFGWKRTGKGPDDETPVPVLPRS